MQRISVFLSLSLFRFPTLNVWWVGRSAHLFTKWASFREIWSVWGGRQLEIDFNSNESLVGGRRKCIFLRSWHVFGVNCDQWPAHQEDGPLFDSYYFSQWGSWSWWQCLWQQLQWWWKQWWQWWWSEIDISISKLLCFETFANFLRVLVSENLVSEKSLSFGKFCLQKKSRFWSQKTWSRKRKNENNKKETRPSKQCESLIWILIFVCFVPIY